MYIRQMNSFILRQDITKRNIKLQSVKSMIFHVIFFVGGWKNGDITGTRLCGSKGYAMIMDNGKIREFL